MKNVNELTGAQKVIVIGLLLLIAGTLFYIITVSGDYVVTYAAQPPFVDECTEVYDNYELVSETCPQSETNKEKDFEYVQ